MKDFKIEANFIFEAEDIEDAFMQLTFHFNNLWQICLGESDEDRSIIKEGYCDIHLKEYE